MGKLQVVKLSEIRENKVALRNVNPESESYLGLVESIREKGFFGAITVRERTDEAGIAYYEVIDGLHRYSAAKAAGIEEINVDVINLEAAEVLEAQIMANIHRVDTKPQDYAKQLLRILTANPYMTEAELAKKLGMSTQWVNNRLSLNKIVDEKIQSLVNEGKINLSNAYALAKLPPEEQRDFVDRAMTEDPEVFIQAAKQRAKEIREAARKGRDAAADKFEPVAHIQKLKDIKEALENGKVADALVKKHKLKSAAEGFEMAIRWVLNLDPESVKAAEAKWNEQREAKLAAKRERDAKKAAKLAEKKKKEAEEAAKVAADIAKQ